MQGSAYVFINFKQALRFGHVGWGFQIGDDRYFFGSTDHLWTADSYLDLPAAIKYSSVKPSDNNDWWGNFGTQDEMLKTMARSHHIWYHAYKSIIIPDAKPDNALATAYALKDRGWHVVRDNCIHQTWDIIKSYGGSSAGKLIPDPTLSLGHRFPRLWFAAIPGQTHLFEGDPQ